MIRRLLFISMALISFSSYGYEESQLWLQKSYGEFKAKVYRVPGMDHSEDHVELEIYSVSDNGQRKLQKSVEIPTPGYKGYISDIKFNSVSSDRVAITFHIEMKAMDGVVLTELFVVDRSGKYKRLIEANYVDFYDDI